MSGTADPISNADVESLWYKNAIFYEVYVRGFSDGNGDGHGDLIGLKERLDYLKDLGVDCIWILPMYPSPLIDGGYDISNYRDIHPDYGNIEDFKELIQTVHDRGMRMIADLVPNHTSNEHEWFQKARSGDPEFQDYYVWSENEDKYKGVRIIFCDHQKSNWSYDEVANKYYWHRFYAEQPDLNFDNPKVQEEMLSVIKYWLDLGIDGFRVDAVPYLFEREGTTCENLPETHEFLRRMRKFVEDNYPGEHKILLGEANMLPHEVIPYFGNGDEFHMNFHFPVMPRIFMSLKKGDKTSLQNVISDTPDIPANSQWCTFLRNHDELTLEMVTEEERQWMWKEYAPEPRMRCNLGIRRRLAPLLDNDRRKIELANSMLFTLPGAPIIYYGDEIGMGDNVELNDRDGVRTPMQWDSTPYTAGFSSNDIPFRKVIENETYGSKVVNVKDSMENPDSLYSWMKKTINIRKRYTVFGFGKLTWAEDLPVEVLGHFLTWKNEKVLCLHNLSEEEQPISVSLLPISSSDCAAYDILKDNETVPVENGTKLETTLGPYEYRWIGLIPTDSE